MKSKWQQEFDALPAWAQRLVDGLAGCAGYGAGGADDLMEGVGANRDLFSSFYVFLRKDVSNSWWEGFWGARDLASALTAPWPPPPAPVREKRAVNVVEIVAKDEDCAFDQPCCFGHRVESHAVYCHNEAWPDSPRKCRRNRDDFLHEDCPGFVRNPDVVDNEDDGCSPNPR